MNEARKTSLPETLEVGLPESMCLKAMLKMVAGKDVLAVECDIRRAGYAQASTEIYGGGEVSVACDKKADCEHNAVLLIENGIIKIAES